MFRPVLAVSALALALAACSRAPVEPVAEEAAKLLEAESLSKGEATTETAAEVGSVSAEAEAPAADPELIAIYKQLHASPELSFQEAKSSALMAAELESLGFDVTTGLGDTWIKEKATRDVGEIKPGVAGFGVVGVLKNGEGPTVLIRADMDALPVPEMTGFDFASQVKATTWTGVDSPVMHACGHDIHMTSWIGTARNLVANKDKWSGTLIMLAQPAEELGNGAQALLADGLYERFPLPDYNLALHVSAGAKAGTVVYTPGYALANVDSVDITVKGVGGHGAYPHTTKDPVLISAHIVTALQSLVARNLNPQTPGVVTVGSIKAGAKHNIIAEEATLLLTVRSFDDDTRTQLLEGIERIAKGQAAAFGAPEPIVRVDSDYTPSTYNDPDLSVRAAKAIGAAIGDENVTPVDATMGGEDFSQYSRTEEKVPSFIFWVGAVEPTRFDASERDGMPLPSLHSPYFAPDYATTITTGVSAMSAAAMDLFNQE